MGGEVAVSVPTNDLAGKLSQDIQRRLAETGVITAEGRAVALGHGETEQRARIGDLKEERRRSGGFPPPLQRKKD